jgi:hypothetical protein
MQSSATGNLHHYPWAELVSNYAAMHLVLRPACEKTSDTSSLRVIFDHSYPSNCSFMVTFLEYSHRFRDPFPCTAQRILRVLPLSNTVPFAIEGSPRIILFAVAKQQRVWRASLLGYALV